jgi:EmrB/QacA subfamily drug resistance transporter
VNVPEAGRSRLIALIISAALFMASLDSTVITTALPQMAHDFALPPVELSLGITVYILVMAAFLPISTWVADRLGARRVFAAAIVGFALSSALCSFSRDLPEFVGARALQALMAALMSPVGNLVLLRSTPKRDLVAAIAISTTPALVAPVIGPAVGGFVVTFVDWPWIFFLNVPIAALGVALALRFIPDVREERRRPFDWRGFALTGSALAAVIYGLDLLASPRGSWPVPTALIGCGLALGAMAVRHNLRAPHPLTPLDALKITTFRVASLTGGTLIRLPFRASGFVLPLLFQVCLGFSAFQSGLLIVGLNGGDLLLKSVANQVLRRIGFRRALASGAFATAAAILSWATFGPRSPFWLIFGLLTLAGMARSVLMTGLVSMTFADVPYEEIGGATVLSNVVNQSTGALGVALAAMVLNLAASRHGGRLELGDCRLAVMAMAAVSLAAVPSFLRLPSDAGAEVSGHRPADGAATAELEAGAAEAEL